MPTMQFREAFRSAMTEEMGRDESVFLMQADEDPQLPVEDLLKDVLV